MGNNLNCQESNNNIEFYTEYSEYLHEFTEK